MARFDVDKPRWDQGTFYGRLMHFCNITDPRAVFASTTELMNAKHLVNDYRSTPAVVFWQWANQSFNALVNFTNRNANSVLTTQELATAYVSASSAALITAIGLKNRLAKSSAGPLTQRFVPLIAVLAANAVNIPLMRRKFGSMVPVGCALFAQKNNISADTLKRFEPISYEKIKETALSEGRYLPSRVFFNKGL
uniref:Uncharacterized protein n=1 Tax=Plectus sambesii TaxID=2011161 RepID=A0A914V6Y1_9BILA